MTVGQFIQRLQAYDPALPIGVVDWGDPTGLPDMGALEKMEVRKTVCMDSGAHEIELLVIATAYNHEEA